MSPDKEARAAPKQIRFDDLEVVVGPWQETQGFLGGYCDIRKMKSVSDGKGFIEPIPGLKVYPPTILIDNGAYPTAGDRTHIIIHEYRHHINTQLWIDSPIYDVVPKEGDTQATKTEKMVKYLNSPDERIAHKTQFKYMLAIGMSREQVLRQLLHGKPKLSDVPVAKEYLGIINEAASELDLEKREREITEKMKADIKQREDDMISGAVDIEFFDPDEPFDI